MANSNRQPSPSNLSTNVVSSESRLSDNSPPTSYSASQSVPPPPPFRRGSLPNLSKSSFGLTKLFTPILMSLSIDNPLIFLYPKSPPGPDQSSPGRQPSSAPSAPNQDSLRERASQSIHASHFSSRQPHPLSHSSVSLAPPSHGQQSSEMADSRSTVLSGSLLLKVLKPKEIKKIIISLWGQSYIGFNDRPYEHQTILADDLELDLKSQLLLQDQRHNPGLIKYNSQHNSYILDKGDYTFNFGFLVNSNTPPYERGQWGRTWHKVVAKVHIASGLGLGFKAGGKHISCIETESYFVAICNPTIGSEEVTGDLGLNFNVTDVSAPLGPYTISASSAYFTVAGLLSFKFRLNEIPQRKKIIKIFKVTCLIKQQYRLISIKDKDSKTGRPAESWPPCQRRRVFVLDHSNVGNVKRVFSNGQPVDPDHDAYDAPYSSEASPSSLRTHNAALRCSPVNPRQEANLQRGTSPSHSRSRSRIRGLMMTPSNREHGSVERSEDAHHHSHHWSSLAHFRLGRRREESSPRPETRGDRSSSRPRFHTSHSAEWLQISPQTPSSPASPGNDQENLLHSSHHAPSNRSSHAPSLAAGNSRYPGQSLAGSRTASPASTGLFETSSRIGNELAVPNGSSEGASRSPVPRNATSVSNAVRGRPQRLDLDSPAASGNNSRSSRSRGRKSRQENRSNGYLQESDKEVPLVTLTDDHVSWEIEHIGRLPNDDIIRPSTNPGTQTNIHIFHTLLFEISYSVEDDDTAEMATAGCSRPSTGIGHSGSKGNQANKAPPQGSSTPPVNRKVLSIGKPVQISSCCCMKESMVLPPYSKLDPNAEIVQHPTPQHAARMFKCACGMSTETLLKTQSPTNSVPNASTQTTRTQLEYRPPVVDESEEQKALRLGLSRDSGHGNALHPWVGAEDGLLAEGPVKSTENR